MSTTLQRFRAWVEILRPPNLPTVPGDPLAGFLLAGLAGGAALPLSAALPLMGAALLLYASGLILNDLADFTEDQQARPERPLPSGRIHRSTAAATAVVLLIAAFPVALFCTGSRPVIFVTALVLLGFVLLYDFRTKHFAVAGSLTMGLCRGMSLLLGASAAGLQGLSHPAVLVAAAGITLYIAAVTAVAFRETERVRLGVLRWLPLAMAVLALVAAALLAGPATVIGAVAAVIALCEIALWGFRLKGTPGPEQVGPAIGGLLRAEVLLQAAFCGLVPGAAAVAAGVLLMWPLSLLLARRFRAS